MPIDVQSPVLPLSQTDFSRLAFKVMKCVFRIHDEFGKFCHEKIHKRQLASRLEGVELEVPIRITFDQFRKQYFIDALVGSGGIFEVKKVEQLTARHRAKLLHYLHCAELAHGKLVNVGTDRVVHEFVNTTLTRHDRSSFTVVDHRFQPLDSIDRQWRTWFQEAVRDWGTGLDLSLYESALIHALGGEGRVTREIEIIAGKCCIGRQIATFCGPDRIFRVTALNAPSAAFEDHSRRFLQNTRLTAIQWIHVGRATLTFQTIFR